MKATIGGLVALLLVAQAALGQTNEERYKKKLAKDFASKITWTKTLEEAKKKAVREDKLIFGYFTRSYAP